LANEISFETQYRVDALYKLLVVEQALSAGDDQIHTHAHIALENVIPDNANQV
jgi:hypothetical protein